MNKLPESELEVMIIIWKEKAEKISVNLVLEKINKEKSITSGALHSYLNRLIEKGFIKCKKEGKFKMITPIISESEYMESESQNILDKLFQGSIGNFISCLYRKNRLDLQDIQELKDFVSQFEENEK